MLLKSVVNADLEIECFLVITGLKHTCYLSFDLAILFLLPTICPPNLRCPMCKLAASNSTQEEGEGLGWRSGFTVEKHPAISCRKRAELTAAAD